MYTFLNKISPGINKYCNPYLLRVLEEKELARLGSNELIRIDVRIIAATNANLQEMIRDKLFRSDLYFRLNIIEIKIPPLRERLDDLADLISFFSKLYTGHDYSVADDDLLLLKKYSWAGNIRELRNVIHSAVILNRDILHALNDYVSNRLTQNPDIERHKAPGLGSEIDNKSMIKVINACNGNMSKAAKQLGVARSTLYRRLNSNK
jgi:transcriptional regulator of acetoin/glycerol metabolism